MSDPSSIIVASGAGLESLPATLKDRHFDALFED
jgi:hypothetical protein